MTARRRRGSIVLVTSVAVSVLAFAAVPVGDGSVTGTPACSLITVAQARSILGYPIQIKRGDTDEDCVLLSVPIKLDPETLRPQHPTVDFSVFADGAHGRSFSSEITEMRKHPYVALTGLGAGATLLPGPSGGSFGVFARVGRKVLQLNAGPAKKPIGQAQGVRLARTIAARF
jgi:hypothetical protein